MAIITDKNSEKANRMRSVPRRLDLIDTNGDQLADLPDPLPTPPYDSTFTQQPSVSSRRASVQAVSDPEKGIPIFESTSADYYNMAPDTFSSSGASLIGGAIFRRTQSNPDLETDGWQSHKDSAGRNQPSVPPPILRNYYPVNAPAPFISGVESEGWNIAPVVSASKRSRRGSSSTVSSTYSSFSTTSEDDENEEERQGGTGDPPTVDEGDGVEDDDEDRAVSLRLPIVYSRYLNVRCSISRFVLHPWLQALRRSVGARNNASGSQRSLHVSPAIGSLRL